MMPWQPLQQAMFEAKILQGRLLGCYIVDVIVNDVKETSCIEEGLQGKCM